jgi:hypothetical protein
MAGVAAEVEVALKVLGSGFLEANPDLAARLRSGEVNLTEWFNELLRLVLSADLPDGGRGPESASPPASGAKARASGWRGRSDVPSTRASARQGPSWASGSSPSGTEAAFVRVP